MLVLGITACWLALVALVFGTFRSSVPRLSLARRRLQESAEPVSRLSRLTSDVTEGIEQMLTRRNWSRPLAAALDRAGYKLTPADFTLLVLSAALLAAVVGVLLGGPVIAILFALLAPIGAKLLLGLREGRRRRAFADQLDDTLQLLSGGLRAGHSLLRAIDSVSREAESPTAEEFARVINETRLGRDLNDALDQIAAKMQSDDFSWVSQAIGVHREVGGDLAEVLDEVANTIRERNQIRRQVASLSAEGKMSAYVLLALPVAVVCILLLTSPSYVARFVEHPAGFAMMGAAAVMMTIGSLWLKKIVSFKF